MNIKLLLNLKLRENYVFCDPNAPLHLSLSEPMGVSQRLTDSIIRGLRAGTILDVDHVVDIEKGTFKTAMVAEEIAEPVIEEKVETPQEEVVEEVVVVEEEATTKTTKKKAAAAK